MYLYAFLYFFTFWEKNPRPLEQGPYQNVCFWGLKMYQNTGKFFGSDQYVKHLLTELHCLRVWRKEDLNKILGEDITDFYLIRKKWIFTNNYRGSENNFQQFPGGNDRNYSEPCVY